MFTYTLRIKTDGQGTILIGSLSHAYAKSLARRAINDYNVLSIEFIKE